MDNLRPKSRRVSAVTREGPKSESRNTKQIKDATNEIFNCCDSETTCKHRKSLGVNGKITSSWTNISEIPQDLMPYAMEPVLKLDDGGTKSPHGSSRRGSILNVPGGAEHEDYDKLDDFQRAVRCLHSDYKTFAATNFDRFIKENDKRAMEEVWPRLAEELRKTSKIPDNFNDDEDSPIESFVGNFHEPASKRFPVAILELYNNNNDDAARKLLELAFEFILCENSDISSYWTTCMEKMVESGNSKNVQNDIYPPVVDKLTGKTSTSNGKIGACRLLRKLASRFSYEVIEKKLFPLLETLSQDRDPLVRSVAVLNMSEMIHRMKQKDPALKLIKTVSEDIDPGVRAAITSTVVQAVTLMNPKDAKNQTFLENAMKSIKHLVKQAYVKGNIDLLVSFSACMGRCCYAFSVSKVLEPRDTLWYLDAFLQLSRYQAHKGMDGNEDIQVAEMPLGFANFRANAEFSRKHSIVEALISTKVPGQHSVDRQAKMNTTKAINVLRSNAESRRVSIPFGGIMNPSNCLRQFGPELERAHECRVNAAREFYDFMLFAKPIVDFKNGLHPLVADLIHDTRPEVRAAMASKLMPIMEYLGTDAYLLHGELVYALSDDDLDVIQAIVPNLAKMLKCLVTAKLLSPDTVTPKLIEIGGAILFCEERLNQTTFYSVHQTMLQQLTVLPFCMPGDYIYNNFVPSLFHRLRHMRQVPCRLEAANAIITFLRLCRRAIQREDIRKRIKDGFAKGRSVHDRMLFLYMAKKIMEKFSKKYFRDHFFEDVLVLAKDPVVNVRRKMMELLPELKNTAEDMGHQRKLEETIINARRSETDRDVRAVTEHVIEKIGNKAALKTVDTTDGAKAIPALLNYQHHTYDPNDDAKEKEEELIATMEHRALRDVALASVKEKRRSFFGGGGTPRT